MQILGQVTIAKCCDWKIERSWALQGEVEGRAGAHAAVDADHAAHRFHEMLHDGQAEARAAELARTSGVDAIEPFEYARQMLRGNTGSRIGDRHSDAAIL